MPYRTSRMLFQIHYSMPFQMLYNRGIPKPAHPIPSLNNNIHNNRNNNLNSSNNCNSLTRVRSSSMVGHPGSVPHIPIRLRVPPSNPNSSNPSRRTKIRCMDR